MSEQTGETFVVDSLMESTLESVDSAEDTILAIAREVGFDEDDQHKIGMSVRECMVNAVVHGNRYNARKKVRVAVGRGADSITILIGDEGDGFDADKVPDPLANENLLRHSGRGILLMQAFMDEFEIRPREPRGTEVRMMKKLAPASKSS
jgi:serine/threonine-protein kinase RsbW